MTDKITRSIEFKKTQKTITDFFKKYDKNNIAPYILIPILSGISCLLLFNQKLDLIPDIFYLSKNKNVSTYLSTILSSIASFTGILIAIFIVAFEYYKTNLKKIYLKYFIGNFNLIILINSYTFVFLFSGISLLLLKDDTPKTSGELTISYMSICSFIILIPMTFIFCFWIVKSLDINHIIDEYLLKLNFDNIYLLNADGKIFQSNHDEQNNVDVCGLVDSDTLYIVEQLLLLQLANDNFVKAQVILDNVFDNFKNYILSKSEIEIENQTAFVQYRFGQFILSLVGKTKVNPQLRNSLILERCLDLINEFYEEFNKRKYKITLLEHLREAFYTRLLVMYEGRDSYIEIILKSISKTIRNFLDDNLPPEKSIMYLEPEYRKKFQILSDDSNFGNGKEDFQYRYSWRKFNEKYPVYLANELNKAIYNKNTRLFINILSLYRDITFNWDLRDIDDHQYLKSKWMFENFRIVKSIYQTAIERELIFDINSFELLEHDTVSNLFKYDYILVQPPINQTIFTWLKK